MPSPGGACIRGRCLSSAAWLDSRPLSLAPYRFRQETMSLPRAFVCAWMFGLLSACATDPASNNGVTAMQFQDVVVPSGMRLREEAHESYSREEAGWRHGHFVYTGQTEVATIANYERERMPQHKWTKVLDEEGQEIGLRLRFERGRYRADYTFTRSDGSTMMVVDYVTDGPRR